MFLLKTEQGTKQRANRYLNLNMNMLNYGITVNKIKKKLKKGRNIFTVNLSVPPKTKVYRFQLSI